MVEVIDKNKTIGQKLMVEVEVNNNKYYIPQVNPRW